MRKTNSPHVIFPSQSLYTLRIQYICINGTFCFSEGRLCEVVSVSTTVDSGQTLTLKSHGGFLLGECYIRDFYSALLLHQTAEHLCCNTGHVTHTQSWRIVKVYNLVFELFHIAKLYSPGTLF